MGTTKALPPQTTAPTSKTCVRAARTTRSTSQTAFLRVSAGFCGLLGTLEQETVVSEPPALGGGGGGLCSDVGCVSRVGANTCVVANED